MLKGQAVFKEAISGLESDIKIRLDTLDDEIKSSCREIRLLEGYPPQIMINNRLIELDGSEISMSQLNKCMISLCDYSVHSHQKELARGFLSLKGGHRAGFAATAVYDPQGRLISFRDITAITIRVARNFEGCSVPVINKVFTGGLCGAIIAGAPSSGKTTVLRDMASQLSTGFLSGYERVVVVDERGELGRCKKSLVLKGYDKAEGIVFATRVLSPQVIFCDEIATFEEAEAVGHALNSGVYVVTTIHAASSEQLIKRTVFYELIKSGAFKRAVVLTDYPVPGTVKEVVDCNELIYKNSRNNHYSFKLLDGGSDKSEAVPRQSNITL